MLLSISCFIFPFVCPPGDSADFSREEEERCRAGEEGLLEEPGELGTRVPPTFIPGLPTTARLGVPPTILDMVMRAMPYRDGCNMGDELGIEDGEEVLGSICFLIRLWNARVFGAHVVARSSFSDELLCSELCVCC